MKQDLVVDTRESWKEWFQRQKDFGDVPLVAREDLPEENQPHRSFYGKMACFANGKDPYPPKPKKAKKSQDPEAP